MRIKKITTIILNYYIILNKFYLINYSDKTNNKIENKNNYTKKYQK